MQGPPTVPALIKTRLISGILVPLIAISLIILIPMNPELAAGLFLVSIAAGATLTGKVAQFTGGNVGQAVSLTIIMTIVTILLMPFLVPFILDGAQSQSPLCHGQSGCHDPDPPPSRDRNQEPVRDSHCPLKANHGLDL
jgi:predicted Na+-dependent transporter